MILLTIRNLFANLAPDSLYLQFLACKVGMGTERCCEDLSNENSNLEIRVKLEKRFPGVICHLVVTLYKLWGNGFKLKSQDGGVIN